MLYQSIGKDNNLLFLIYMHVPESIFGTPIARFGYILTHEGWEYNVVVECLPSMCQALGSTSSTTKKQQ
jgi:hypothetical protein